MSVMQLNLDDIVVARKKLEAIGLVKTYFKEEVIVKDKTIPTNNLYRLLLFFFISFCKKKYIPTTKRGNIPLFLKQTIPTTEVI